MRVVKNDGTVKPFEIEKIHDHSKYFTEGLEGASQSELETAMSMQLYDMMPTSEISENMIKTAADLISKHEDYSYAAARALMNEIFKEVTGGPFEYPHLQEYLHKGIVCESLSQDLLDDPHIEDLDSGFDIEALHSAIKPERDRQWKYLGLCTIKDRYLRRDQNNNIIELPQHMWMRVAMGIALAESRDVRTEKAIEFYDVLSQFDFMCSTPTLFNAGTRYPQLSSCFLLSMGDSIDGIMDTLKEAAYYSKFAGGLAVDFNYIRGSGSYIKSTQGTAGGPVRYMKSLNDVLLGFDQGGKRKGVGAVYLEPWHSDFLSYLELRNINNDERDTAHDLFPASWINDLLMERKAVGGDWSFFCPKDTPDLHDLYGDDFKAAYERYEAQGLARATMPAEDLWRKIISKLYEHGVFWPNFKDTINIRNMQKGSGVVHSSNLCTEITLNTVPNEVSAVCNLGSINLSNHVAVMPDSEDAPRGSEKCLEYINFDKIIKTTETAIRMLDNVIEVGLVPHENGAKFNKQERAIGYGMMGLTEAFGMLGINYESPEAMIVNAAITKTIARSAIYTSSSLAKERGAYPLYEESEWAKGRLPWSAELNPKKNNLLRLITKHFNMNEADAAGYRDVLGGLLAVIGDDRNLIDYVLKNKMRNSNVMAIAPTATIANIVGTSSCTELPLLNEYVKTNLSGDFLHRSPLLKYFGASAPTARSVDQKATILAAAVRQTFIDQSQSTNIYLPVGDISGQVISDWYTLAWEAGVKTTYYLRGVSEEEVSPTIESPTEEELIPPVVKNEDEDFLSSIVCSIENPEACDSCQ